MILTGMSDAFIQKNIERLRYQSSIGRVVSMQRDVESVKLLITRLQAFPGLNKHHDPTSPTDNMATKPFLTASTILLSLQALKNHRNRKQSQQGSLRNSNYEQGVVPPPAQPQWMPYDLPTFPNNQQTPQPPFLGSPQGPKFAGYLSPVLNAKNPPSYNNDRIDIQSRNSSLESSFIRPTPKPTLRDPVNIDLGIFQKNSSKQPTTNMFDSSRLRPGGVESEYMDYSLEPHAVPPGLNFSAAEHAQDNPAELLAKIEHRIDMISVKLDSYKRSLEDKHEKIEEEVNNQLITTVKKNMTIGNVKPSATNNPLLFILHDNWSLMASMMYGIQKSVNSITGETGRLTDRDFTLRNQFELKPAQINNKDSEVNSHSSTLFYDYAPSVFNEIRKQFGVDNKVVGNINLVSRIFRH